MLISKIVSLIVEGYGGLPAWYLGVFGWGTVALLVVGAVLVTVVPWRRSPDDFTPWPPYPPASDERTPASQKGVRS